VIIHAILRPHRESTMQFNALALTVLPPAQAFHHGLTLTSAPALTLPKPSPRNPTRILSAQDQRGDVLSVGISCVCFNKMSNFYVGMDAIYGVFLHVGAILKQEL